MDEIIVNVQPIIDLTILCAVVLLLGIIAFLFHNLQGLNLFSRHDNSIIEKFLSKYPDVTPEFMQKNAKAQNIENNQEIHEINKRIDAIEANQKEILDLLAKLQNKD